MYVQTSNYEHVHFLTTSEAKKNFTLTFFNTQQTDDYGVFQTTLTRELTIAAEIYKLTETELIELMENANRYSFARPCERQLIGDKIEEFKKNKISSH